jgi:23S rRNA (adenine2030-N6)-methyltransferase
MNYRHAYHAGNFADCCKHALLLLLIRFMQRKAKPILVLDTHAGCGRYDLRAGPAERTGEWRQGIVRLQAENPAALGDYLELVAQLGLYPGSPLIAQSLLRPVDRLVACELHPEDAQLLKAEFAGVRNVAVHERDGYAAMRAFLPPPEKRGLVLIDPPFEQPDEFARVAKNLEAAWRRFDSGVYAVWYPIKHRAPVRDFVATLRLGPIRDVVAAELLLRAPVNPARLNGCGLLIVNPPYGFEEAAMPVCQALAASLGEAGGNAGIERLIDE